MEFQCCLLQRTHKSRCRLSADVEKTPTARWLGKRRWLPAGERISAGVKAVTFTPDQTAIGGGIALLSKGGDIAVGFLGFSA